MSAYNNLSIKELKDTQKELSLRLKEVNEALDRRAKDEAHNLEVELYDIFRKIGNNGFEINIIKDSDYDGWDTETMTLFSDDLKENRYTFEVYPGDS